MPSNELNQPPTPVHQSSMTFHLLLGFSAALVVLLGVLTYKYISAPNTTKPAEVTKKSNTLTLPANAVRVSGCIAHEGEHWVEPENIPYGPFYVTYNGKMIAFEYMFTDEDIPGKELAHMSPPEAEAYLQENQMTVSGMVNMLSRPFALPDVAFKDWKMHWTPPHAAFVKPHYDVHFYLVDKAERDQVCPNSTFGDILPVDLKDYLKDKGIAVPEAGNF